MGPEHCPMFPRVRSLAVLSLLVLPVSAAVEVHAAVTPGRVAEVNVSADVRRVTIRTEGHVGSHAESTVANPSRLVIDISGANLAKPLTVTGAGRERGLAIRAAKSESGVRIVLDFGGSPIPEYRIRRVGNHLLVFFREWEPKAGAGTVTGLEPTASKELEPVAKAWPGGANGWRTSAHAARREEVGRTLAANNHRIDTMEPRQRTVESGQADEASGELFIKSAEVNDGVIVLHVAKRSHPSKVYRIDLGVDLSELGLRIAKISEVVDAAKQPARVAECQSPFLGAPSQLSRIGPRKP